ncbi:hypothetical protein V8B97DRAFT_1919739 [Scleroderma yunnanense]
MSTTSNTPQSLPRPTAKVHTSFRGNLCDGRGREKLIAWLVAHPADHHILFHDHAGISSASSSPSTNEKPSRKNKEVQAVIAKHIFENDPNYMEQYEEHPEKFASSLGNWLVLLKQKYQEAHDCLKKTGSGIIPGGLDANILAEIHHNLPFFDNLDIIWHGIPSLDSKISTSEPNIDHAEKFLGLVQQKAPCGIGGEEDNNTQAAVEEDMEGPGTTELDLNKDTFDTMPDLQGMDLDDSADHDLSLPQFREDHGDATPMETVVLRSTCCATFVEG